MLKVMGLDISSSIIGVAIIENNTKFRHLQYVDLTKNNDIWEKIDHVRNFFIEKFSLPEFQNITNIAVEEALLSFRQGFSSAQTITTLVRMNALTCMLARDIFKLTPDFIPSATARKVCGIRTQQVGKCGKSIKEQVFDHMLEYDLNDLKSVWPMKKQTKKSIAEGKQPKHQDWCYDVCDAYVIARASIMLNS